MSSSYPASVTTAPAAASAISGHLDTRTAAYEVADEITNALGERCDLAMIFGSFHHRAAFDDAAEIIRNSIGAQTLMGVTAESVLGVDQELEGFAGLSVLAMRLPGARLKAWTFHRQTSRDVLRDPAATRRHIGLNDATRAIVILADPFTTPMSKLLPALSACGDAEKRVPVIGGMASGASQPGHNVLVLDDRVSAAGAVAVSISGDFDLDVVLSQGCRPVGDTHVVTKAKGNVILELGGVRSLEIVQETAERMTEHERELLGNGLLIGMVIDEYKEHLGRGDFLVRNMLGYDQKNGAIAVGDIPRVGQTVQFHVRDADTAHEDLQLLMDGQQLKDPPFAGLLITCNGRGKRMFGSPHHDVKIIRNRVGEIAMAGFFAAGEIGPVGARSFVHGHTASLGLFRARPS